MYLVCHQDALSKWVENAWKLWNKEDPSHPFYGVVTYFHDRHNLKTTKAPNGPYLSAKVPIYLEYDREKRTVKIYSKDSEVFEYYQDNLSAEMTYAIGVALWGEGQ